MSHHARGVIDGVVHYCDPGVADFKTPTGKVRKKIHFAWCQLGWKRGVTPIENVVKKPVMVTCIQCLWIRARR